MKRDTYVNKSFFGIAKWYSVLFVFCSAVGYGQGQKDNSSHQKSGACDNLLVAGQAGKVEIVGSGRNDDVMPFLEQEVQDIMGPGGIADRLGIPLPHGQVNFAPSDVLTSMAAVGRHPIGHSHDGYGIVSGSAGAGGVLEFVTPACTTCRSYYQDSTNPMEQVAILHHVVGHNHFAARNPRARQRNSDPMEAALRLHNAVAAARAEVGDDEPEVFYRFLQSTYSLQPFNGALFRSPEYFANSKFHQPGHSLVEFGGALDQNSLQALVAAIPASAPEWKKKIAKEFEEVYRSYGYYSPFKIMNEGWATILMEILPTHSKWANNDEYQFRLAHLMTGVAYPGLSNPYWLGREAWRRLRARFNEKPEIKNLSPFERDKKFISYADELIRTTANDYDFLRLALDESFVLEHGLYIQRKLEMDEVDWSLPGDDNLPWPYAQYEVDSTNPQEVIRFIADLVADKEKSAPPVGIVSFKGAGDSSLQFRSASFKKVPINRSELGQALYVFSQIIERPISFDGWFILKGVDSASQDKSLPSPPWYRPTAAKMEMLPLRVKVSPEGKVDIRVLRYGAEDSAQPMSIDWSTVEIDNGELASWIQSEIEKLKGSLEGRIQYFHDHTGLTVSRAGRESFSNRFRELVTTITNGQLNEFRSQVIHQTPHLPEALLRYADMLRRILPERMRAFAQGKLRSKIGRNGTKISVFPPIPHIDWDWKGLEAFEKWQKEQADDKRHGYYLVQNNAGLANTLASIAKEGVYEVNGPFDHLRFQELADDRQGNDDPNQQMKTSSLAPVPSADSSLFVPSNVLAKEYAKRVWAPTQKGTSVSNSQTGLSWDSKSKKAFTDVPKELLLAAGDRKIGSDPRKKRKGDRYWGPDDSQEKGDGDGEEDGEGDSEESDDGEGKEPNPGVPGEDGFIEIPDDAFATILTELFELPNTRPKAAGDKKREDVRAGEMHQVSGEVLWDSMADRIISLGKASLQRQGAVKPTARECYEEGVKFLTDTDFIVRGREVRPSPEIQAVLVFVIDMSGSMSGEPYRILRKVLRNMRLLLKKKYKKIDIRIVGFSGEAKEFKEENWHKFFIGGSTDYVQGLSLAEKILSTYSASSYDKYVVIGGDGQDVNPQGTINFTKKWAPMLQYLSFILTDVYGIGVDGLPIASFYAQQSKSDPYFGFSYVSDALGSEAKVMNDLFGKNKKK